MPSTSNVTLFTLNKALTFGKYKGKTVEEVITLDPDYLLWARKNIEWFEIELEVFNDAWELSGALTNCPAYVSKIKEADNAAPVKYTHRDINGDLFDDDIPF